MHSLRIGYIIDPIETLKFGKDSSVALMKESQRRGFTNYAITLSDLFLDNDTAKAHAAQIELDVKSSYKVHSRELLDLSDQLDVILMRKDPPFDVDYIMSTYILERAGKGKAIVLNDPAALREINEKVAISQFPAISPPNLLTASAERIQEFIELHEKVVIKPTNLMGGRSIYILAKGDPNVPVIIEDVTLRGERYVIVQKYIPAIREHGDKRIILINGKPLPYGIARVPRDGDHRGNLVTGAEAVGFELGPPEFEICNAIGPYLTDHGLFFVGIDVIGDQLTEINITSPTGIVEIEKAFGFDGAAAFFDALLDIYF